MRRREFLKALALVAYPRVLPGHRLRFPRDFGAHPAYRVEWWYVTGWLGDSRGFQVTFFRVRSEWRTDNPSRFTPRQLVLAHAALADPARGHLIHRERAAREGFGLAGADEGRTHAWIDDWSLGQEAGGAYRARIPAPGLEFDLRFEPKRLVLQGEGGFSRKGPRPLEASYYYSQPHLAVTGTVAGETVSGEGWLDHEWSSAYLPRGAVGWDWTGINLFDGGAVMAFRMRKRDGTPEYAPPGVAFEPLRWWRSPRTGVSYPVSMRVRKDGLELRLEPLMDDQELDARASTGTIYWEGAVRAWRGEREVGRGYLELTGYAEPMKL